MPKISALAVNAAFKALHKAGYYAKRHAACCRTCAIAEMPDEAEKWVFLTDQDEADLRRSGSCYVSWSGDAKEICKAFAKHGISTEHNGSKKDRILIKLR